MGHPQEMLQEDWNHKRSEYLPNEGQGKSTCESGHRWYVHYEHFISGCCEFSWRGPMKLLAKQIFSHYNITFTVSCSESFRSYLSFKHSCHQHMILRYTLCYYLTVRALLDLNKRDSFPFGGHLCYKL